jgi:chromosome condensin MukBEF MukE localization factor
LAIFTANASRRFHLTFTPAQLSFLSRAAFEEFANKNPEVYRSLLTMMDEEKMSLSVQNRKNDQCGQSCSLQFLSALVRAHLMQLLRIQRGIVRRPP